MVNENESTKLFDHFLFPKIFQTFRMAIQPSKLIIAFIAVAVICGAGWLMDFNKTVVTSIPGNITELQIYVDNPDNLPEYIEIYKEEGERTGVFSSLWHFGSDRFHSALNLLFKLDIPGVAKNIADCFQAVIWALRYHFIYSIIFFAIILVIISLAGGAICRIAALQFAQGEKPGLTEALRFSIKKFPSFFTAPLTPVGMIIFIGLFIFLLGLVGNIPYVGQLIMGVFMLLALIAGVLIAMVLIGTVAGFNLMFPTIAYEGSDCFDAISRSFSYIYARPWRMGFYTVIAVVYGAICYIFTRFFAFLVLWTNYRFLQLGVLGDNNKLTSIWREPSFTDFLVSSGLNGSNWLESVADFLVYLLLLIIVGLLVSFIISFYFSANTIIYSLMRNRVDNTALGDVYRESDEIKTEPSTSEVEPEKTQTDSNSQNQPSSSLPTE